MTNVSPFAKTSHETYVYPHPIDSKREEEMVEESKALGAALPYQNRLHPDVMSEDPDQRPWIKVRIARSKGDVDAVAELTQSLVTLNGQTEGATIEQRIRLANRGVFKLLVEEWSFDAEITEGNFDRLDTWAADWVGACLADAVNQGTDRDYGKKTNGSSPKPASSRRKSPGTTSKG